jgi:hypothetical protein
MERLVDPVWLAEQLMIAPRDLLLIPFGTAATLWLLARLIGDGRKRIYARAPFLLVTAPRFALGFLGGLALTAITIGLWAQLSPRITGKPSELAANMPLWLGR